MIKHKMSAFGRLAKVKSAKSELSRSGVYILYRTNAGNMPAWVGRADFSLYNTLSGYATHPQYKYYKYMPCKSASEAYQWECIFWHSGANSLDNASIHPKKPGSFDVSCPYPGCDAGAHSYDVAPELDHEELMNESVNEAEEELLENMGMELSVSDSDDTEYYTDSHSEEE